MLLSELDLTSLSRLARRVVQTEGKNAAVPDRECIITRLVASSDL
jgi:hypothetical protein